MEVHKAMILNMSIISIPHIINEEFYFCIVFLENRPCKMSLLIQAKAISCASSAHPIVELDDMFPQNIFSVCPMQAGPLTSTALWYLLTCKGVIYEIFKVHLSSTHRCFRLFIFLESDKSFLEHEHGRRYVSGKAALMKKKIICKRKRKFRVHPMLYERPTWGLFHTSMTYKKMIKV